MPIQEIALADDLPDIVILPLAAGGGTSLVLSDDQPEIDLSLDASQAATLELVEFYASAGGGNESVQATAGAAMLIGTPLVVSGATGKLVPADAASLATSRVVGVASASYGDGFPATAMQGSFKLLDWTAITGSPSLSPGVTYFLSVGGGLSASPPAIPGQYVVVVGVAISATAMLVQPMPPLEL